MKFTNCGSSGTPGPGLFFKIILISISFLYTVSSLGFLVSSRNQIPVFSRNSFDTFAPQVLNLSPKCRGGMFGLLQLGSLYLVMVIIIVDDSDSNVDNNS